MTSSKSIPAPDRMVAGQPYWLDRTEPYRCRDGRDAALDVYLTHCAECGMPFEAKALAGSGKALNRRCAKHRRPGIKVRSVKA